jgi:hypothetical protein
MYNELLFSNNDRSPSVLVAHKFKYAITRVHEWLRRVVDTVHFPSSRSRFVDGFVTNYRGQTNE